MDTTNINNKIFINIYSYKEPDLVGFIDSLIKNSSGKNELYFYIEDQNNLTRLKRFIGYKNVLYNVIWWDELISPIYHVAKTMFDNVSKGYNYGLLLKRHVTMQKDWDLDLIDKLPNDSVFSGTGNYEISIKNNFYLNKKNNQSNNITDVGYIDRSFIFGKFSDLLKIDMPISLKYHGEEEYISMSLLNQNIKILSLPSGYYSYLSNDLDKRGYVPFSLNHNYNDLVAILKKEKPIKLKYQNPSIFLEKIKLDMDNLFKLPFDFNDIEYDRSSSLDNLGGKRYIERLNSVS